jgi:type III secretion protein V
MINSYFQSKDIESEAGKRSGYSDIAVIVGVIFIVALLIIPLPMWMLDCLVALNICSGIVLLLMAIYVGSAVEFSVFPSVLLLTTVFRLAISIATTKTILLHGEAGHIIETFGKMVAGGNVVVGLVVFLIITVVQFIVIAKGAERVAEVAARFSLDAMPGKQMSIDSDLRSGLLDKDEARARRKMLELESKLHGSMDGAMKFVKGDAMCGIIIIIINLLAGLTIGVVQKDMEMGDAAVKYSILTIGEGLVAQIPALLAALSAGLIVTRTAGNDKERHLGEAISQQLGAKPRVLLAAGGVCAIMGLVPGFPWLVFAALAVSLGVLGAFLTPALKPYLQKVISPAQASIGKSEATMPKLLSAASPKLTPMVPLLLELNEAQAKGFDGKALANEIAEMLQNMNLRMGIALPRLEIHTRPFTKDRPNGAGWQLSVYEVPVAEGNFATKDVVIQLVKDVNNALRRQLSLFIGTQETANILMQVTNDLPELAKELGRAMPMPRIAEILKRLAEEEVSLRNMRDLIEGLSDAAQHERDPFALTEFTRIALKRQLSHQYAPTGEMRALLLDQEIEQTLRQGISDESGSPRLALDPLMVRGIIDQVKMRTEASSCQVIVTSVDIRRHLRKLIEQDLFDVAVLSFHELTPQLKLDVSGYINLPILDVPMLQAAE